MSGEVAIIGIGLHPFGRSEGLSGLQQGAAAVRAALADAGVDWSDIDLSCGGSLGAGAADSLVGVLGLSGAPFINVANGCATGGSALYSAAAAIRAGQARLALAVGFDKHPRGAFNADPAALGLPDWYGRTGLMLTTQFFALKARRYLHEHGLDEELLSRVAERAYRNGARNPQAWRRQAISREEIAASAPINLPLRKYMMCSPAEGAAALVLCDAAQARRWSSRPVLLKAVSLRTREYGSFEVFSPSLAAQAAPAPTVAASRAAFEQAGVGPGEIRVAQLQDTDAASEIIHLAENGFCAHGEQAALIRGGATEIDGVLPVNTDGGCLANGEPIGASGLRQVYEVCLQLRGQAGARQVPHAPKLGYTHVYGAPGVSAVTILQV